MRTVWSAVLLVVLVSTAPAAAQEANRDSAGVPTSGEIRELTIPSAPEIALAGTLRLPVGHGPGPFPLVISMSGDGPNPRGAYHLLSERLLARGIATFEYDKRGAGASTGRFEPLLSEAAADGRAVFEYLKSSARIDARRIAVTGHSEGAAAAPIFLRDRDDVAAFVSLAGPAGTRGPMFLDAFELALTSAGRDPARVSSARVALATFLDGRIADLPEARMAALGDGATGAFRAMGLTATEAAAMLASLDTPQTRQMYDLDPSDNLARIRAPVLMVYGSLDRIVRSEANIGPAVAALRDNPDAAVVTVGGVDHWLIRSETGEPRPDMGWPVSAPEVLDLVAQWLVRRLQPGGGA